MEVVLSMKQFFNRNDKPTIFSIEGRNESSQLELQEALAPSDYQLNEEDDWYSKRLNTVHMPFREQTTI
uniref:Anaphase-promoting complex subunit 13 n=1 Tax=Caenorhabditis tropicalis TaxID=1561998 RepID=A0A1I7TPB7_9PELO